MDMSNIIIALSGKAHSGKTEAMKVLMDEAEKDGLEFINIPLAGALKQIAAEHFGWDGDKEIYFEDAEEVLDGYLKDDGTLDRENSIIEKFKRPIPDKGRQLLINIGDKFREIRPTIWADILIKKINTLDAQKPNGVIYCVDDLRYKNEIAVLSQYPNTILARISRPDGQLNLQVKSELDLDGVEFINKLDNIGSLGEYRDKVKEFYCNEIKKRL
jgi:hypothetical protein